MNADDVQIDIEFIFRYLELAMRSLYKGQKEQYDKTMEQLHERITTFSTKVSKIPTRENLEFLVMCALDNDNISADKAREQLGLHPKKIQEMLIEHRKRHDS